MKFHTIWRLKILFISALILVSAGCRAGGPVQATEGSVTQMPPSPMPTSTATPGPELLILVKPDSTTPAYVPVRSLLENYAADHSLELRELAAADLSTDLESGVRLIVALEPNEVFESIVRANPETGFIISGEITGELGNLFVLGGDVLIHDRIGFMAGYTAALITPDYRVGGIALGAEGPERAALEGFLNGVVFYCGLCRAAYPPFNSYPQTITIPSAVPVAVQSAVQQLKDLGVTTIYLSPGLSREAVFTGLSATGIRYLGSATPTVVDGFTWAATLTSDKVGSVQLALERWSGGEAGQVIEGPLVIMESDETVLSPGKLNYLEGILHDLASGRIDSGVDPDTGEAR